MISSRPEKISIIVATGSDRAIGRNGDLAFHIRADLRNFKRITMGRPVIMGRKTFESLPNGALPGRRNIVITRNAAYSPLGAETAGSLEEALRLTAGVEEAMIIGGGMIYEEAMPLADTLYITEIDATLPDADTFFPEIGPQWTLAEASEPQTDETSGLSYRFTRLERKS
ncbi:MAG: dihydrofolate reductase [Paramuribaculum sp.]|nr:dihydrofolate reductase [Paramuribaculum sp.]